MRPKAVQAINAAEPFKGGNDTLWRLHKLNNIDKHRALVTLGSYFRSFDVGSHVETHLRKSLADNPHFSGIEIPTLPPVFLKPADTLFPLKAGAELFADGPDAEVNPKLAFRFDIALGEPGVVEGESLMETLQQMSRTVVDLISKFRPLLT